MTTRTEPDALLLALGPRPGRDVGRWLQAGLRAAVVEGRLEAGVVLPSSRDAAAALGVSRGTVTTAVDVLVGEGLLVSRPRSGVVVAALPAPPSGRAGTAAAGPTGAAPGVEPDTGPRPVPGARPVSVGTPDPALFPRAAWARAVRDGVRGLADADLGYPDPQGLPALREALAVHLRRARGAHVAAEDVVVVSGVAQALSLLARLLAAGRVAGARPAEPVRVAVEDPSSRGALELLRDAGLRTVGVPVDADGLRADLLPDDARAVLVTPAHQFPLGVVLAPARRRALLAWAAAGERLVLEDDYDAELRYDRQPVASVQALDPERVVLLGSVSKLLSPALRLGWVVAPPRVVGPLVEAKRHADLGTSVPEQAALAALLGSGAYQRHLRRARLVYQRRRRALLDALGDALPGVEVGGVAAGLHLVVPLPGPAAERAALDGLHAAGVPAEPLSGTGVDRTEPGVVVGTARVREAEVARVVEVLRAAVLTSDHKLVR
ncbi:GntR family transcriptional regulator/MocR family aminotransferase [Cellulosimicrobium cellulans]|uniref:MocR-like pyridoxine biosynthesis transcription factor PdxR n=1 Tax=Cellulosimicrobium cellulans TaxID=1710 RepID=UPI0019583782|nr:PLP-dependent aminotransferase family protein [Cellulosimicrobium cellulans]MBM7818844.1 GntR family transcriptional regulator/MocR family aminotransferase [Cellulosimicrobium cellulans]